MSRGLLYWQRLSMKKKLSPEFRYQIERNIRDLTPKPRQEKKAIVKPEEIKKKKNFFLSFLLWLKNVKIYNLFKKKGLKNAA